MSSYKLHGNFRPGFKRFKSDSGNDCLAFYPVNVTVNPTEINAYRSPAAAADGAKRTG